MGKITIRMSEEKHARLRELASELATISLAQFDAETRFRARAEAGSAAKGLRVLDKLDRHFGTTAGR